jgi:hypothetical protein
MSTKSGLYKGHMFHGDPLRFEVVAEFVVQTFGRRIKTIADVAGGKGMLSRILAKKYNYNVTVVDPRGFTLVGVKSIPAPYSSDMATTFDLVIGLHPDEATRPIAESAMTTNTLLIPCCNFWDSTKKLGRDALLKEIEDFYAKEGVVFRRVLFDFEGPKNIGLLSLK